MVTKSKSTIHDLLGLDPSIPVRSATDQLFVPVHDRDISSNAKGDPTRCAVACAVKRVTRLNKMKGAAAVFRRKAYSLQLYRGKPVLLKYAVPRSLRTLLVIFDLTGEFPKGGFYLNPMPPSWSKEHQRIYKANEVKKRAAGIPPRKNRKSAVVEAKLLRQRAPGD